MRKSFERGFQHEKKTLKNGADMRSDDSLGSYTGVPEDEHEQPVQDADDL